MHIASTLEATRHAPAASRDVCNSAALCGLVQMRKAAVWSWKINSKKNLQGLYPELLSITPVVRQQAVLVTTR
jgi:hypothetical protein